MFWNFAAIVTVGIGAGYLLSRKALSVFSFGSRRQLARGMFLAIVLALGAIAPSARAETFPANGAPLQQNAAGKSAAKSAASSKGPGEDYASREARSKGLEKFAGP